MKKHTAKFLALALALVLALSLTACSGDGAGGVSEVGTWTRTDMSFSTIEQGKLGNSIGSTITLMSDNTYILTSAAISYYSSDGGETYNPASELIFIVYGAYETVSTDDELGESTIKITSVTRVVKPDYDSAKEASDEDKELMASNDFIGTEIILGNDHKTAEVVTPFALLYVGGYENPYA